MKAKSILCDELYGVYTTLSFMVYFLYIYIYIFIHNFISMSMFMPYKRNIVVRIHWVCC